MSTQDMESGLTSRNAHAERTRLRKQQEAQQLAQMVAAAMQPQSAQSTQATVSLEDFNRLKAELEQTRLALQNTNQELKPIVTEYKTAAQEQFEVTADFVKDRLIRRPTARVLNYDMNFELIEYAKERGCIINHRKVKPLLEAHKIEYKPSDGKYYFMGVDLV